MDIDYSNGDGGSNSLDLLMKEYGCGIVDTVLMFHILGCLYSWFGYDINHWLIIVCRACEFLCWFLFNLHYFKVEELWFRLELRLQLRLRLLLSWNYVPTGTFIMNFICIFIFLRLHPHPENIWAPDPAPPPKKFFHFLSVSAVLQQWITKKIKIHIVIFQC